METTEERFPRPKRRPNKPIAGIHERPIRFRMPSRVWYAIVGLGLALVQGPAVAQVPQGVVASADDREVALAWEPPSLESGTIVACYRVYRDTTSIPNGDPGERRDLRVARVDTTSDGAPSYTDTGLANGIRYFYRVTAETAEPEGGSVSCGSGNTDESGFSNQESATPAAPTSLRIAEPSAPVAGPVEVGNEVEVDVEGTNVPPNAPVQLRYRRGGEASFQVASMERDDSEFSASIPGSEVTVRGVEFVVTTQDEQEETVRAPADGVVSVRVQAESLSFSQPGGTAPSAYRLVSFPTRLADRTLSTLFESLAPYNPDQWRLFEIGSGEFSGSGGGYAERDNLAGRLQAGEGLWLISRSSATLGPVQGTSIRTDQPFEISLREGWTLIGNPFAFAIPASQLRVESGGAPQDVFGYDGSFVPKTEDDVLQPYRGYLVRLADGQSGTLRIDPTPDAPSSAATTRRTPVWTMNLSARVGQARDKTNVIGVSPGAEAGRNDGHEPPPIGQYVSLAFEAPSTESVLWRDMRAPTAGGAVHTWTAQVRTNVAGRVRVSAAVQSVPRDKAVWLVDPALGLTQNLRETPRYSFVATGSESPRTLRIVAGAPSAVTRAVDPSVARPQRVRLLPSAPNPVRGHATLRYEVPTARRVTLEVVDLLGRRVATLIDGQTVTAGRHARTWSPSRHGLSSGLYLLRLRAGGATRTQRLTVVR